MAFDHGLKGRAAVVTGSTSGIGRAMAAALAAEGVELRSRGRIARRSAREAKRSTGRSRPPRPDVLAVRGTMRH